MIHSIIRSSIHDLSLLNFGDAHKLFKNRIIIHLYKGERYIHMGFENYKLLKLLQIHYGIGTYLSLLYIYISGYQVQALYISFPYFLDNNLLIASYAMINQKLIHIYISFMRRKLSITSY